MDGWDLAMERYRWAVRLLGSGIQGASIPAAKGSLDPRPLPECRARGNEEAEAARRTSEGKGLGEAQVHTAPRCPQ